MKGRGLQREGEICGKNIGKRKRVDGKREEANPMYRQTEFCSETFI